MRTSRAAALAAFLLSGSPAAAQGRCDPGVYGASELERVVLPAPLEGQPQRYVFLDGRRGTVGAPGAVVTCDVGSVRVKGGEGAEGAWQPWTRVALDETRARFRSHAIAEIMASHFTRGFGALAALKRRLGAAPWLARIEGEFTGEILRMDEATLRRIGVPILDPVNVMWRYDNVALMRSLDAPVLWAASSTRSRRGAVRRVARRS